MENGVKTKGADLLDVYATPGPDSALYLTLHCKECDNVVIEIIVDDTADVDESSKVIVDKLCDCLKRKLLAL